MAIKLKYVIASFLISTSLFSYPHNIEILKSIDQSRLQSCNVVSIDPNEVTKMLVVVDNSLMTTVEEIGKKQLSLKEEVDNIINLVQEANALIKKDLNDETDYLKNFLETTQSKANSVAEKFNSAKSILDKSQTQIGDIYCNLSQTIKELNNLKKDKNRDHTRITRTISQLSTKIDFIFRVLETLDGFYASFNTLIDSAKNTKNDIEDLRRDINVFFNEQCKEESEVCKYVGNPISSYIKIENNYIIFTKAFVKVSTITKSSN